MTEQKTTENPDTHADFDVVVVGGGPAGLQAALTAGRVHRKVLQLDSGEYRNATVSEMHNLIGRDGAAPADLRADARAELARYGTITSRATSVESIVRAADVDGRPRFTVRLGDGDEVSTSAVILATGIRDELPAVPGMAESWGGRIANCPFCHGHEFSGQRVGIVGAALASHQALMLGPIASDLVVFSQGEDVPESLRADGIEIVEAPVERVREDDGGLTVSCSDGRDVEVSGLFVMPQMHQRAGFIADLERDLGLEISEGGFVRVDERSRTSVPGIYAAGDMAVGPNMPMPMFSVGNAIFGGLAAGATSVADAIMPTAAK